MMFPTKGLVSALSDAHIDREMGREKQIGEGRF